MSLKKHEEHVNHERWLVSYADFITLLFAFFVVMFASSQADKGKAQQVSDSVTKALAGEKLSATIAKVLGGTVDNRGQGKRADAGAPKRRKTRGAGKREKGRQAGGAGAVATGVVRRNGRPRSPKARSRSDFVMEPRLELVVSFKQAALFPSGEDTIAPDSLPSLDKVAAAIIKIPNPVRLEGHTDSRKINTKRFRSNWDLSRRARSPCSTF